MGRLPADEDTLTITLAGRAAAFVLKPQGLPRVRLSLNHQQFAQRLLSPLEVVIDADSTVASPSLGMQPPFQSGLYPEGDAP